MCPASPIILGIDPGLATTGYGLIQETEHGELKSIDFGVILTPSDETLQKRLLILHQEIKKITLLYQPAQGAVEKLFFQKNVKTAMTVGQARGVVLLALAETGLAVEEYTPLEIKQAITGYGNASKIQIQQMVKSLLNLEDLPKPDDAADALAVAICHLHHNQYRDLIAS